MSAESIRMACAIALARQFLEWPAEGLFRSLPISRKHRRGGTIQIPMPRSGSGRCQRGRRQSIFFTFARLQILLLPAVLQVYTRTYGDRSEIAAEFAGALNPASFHQIQSRAWTRNFR